MLHQFLLYCGTAGTICCQDVHLYLLPLCTVPIGIIGSLNGCVSMHLYATVCKLGTKCGQPAASLHCSILLLQACLPASQRLLLTAPWRASSCSASAARVAGLRAAHGGMHSAEQDVCQS